VKALGRSVVLNQGNQDARRALGQIEELIRRQKERTPRPAGPAGPGKNN
jgi:hypothetical protein